MPVKFKKIKKNTEMGTIGLGAFPVVTENIQNNEIETVENSPITRISSPVSRIRKSIRETTRETESVPKIPAAFYEEPHDKDDALSRELDILSGAAVKPDSELSRFLVSLKKSIYADKTWFASGRSGDAVFSLTSSDDDRLNAVSADNGLVAHAMSIDHLMFVKNKVYIDELVDNSIGMTSMFIVPINKPNIHGMVLAGYKSPKGELSKIVTTLNECKDKAMNYL